MTNITLNKNDIFNVVAKSYLEQNKDIKINNKKTETNKKDIKTKKESFIIKYLKISIKLLLVQIRIFLHNSRFFIDKHFSFLLLNIFELNIDFLNLLKIQLEKYIKKMKYSDLWQFERTLSDVDIAFISLSIPEGKNITLKEIMNKYKISYHNSLRVKKMIGNKLESLSLIKNYSEDKSN